MIIRPRLGLADLLFALNGSILPRIVGRLAAIATITIGAVVYAGSHPAAFAQLGAIPFTLVGLALSIFMSFRNNACYERWWEGRKLWGHLIIACRSLARQASALPAADQRLLLHALCGFANGLAARLRGQDEAAAIGAWAPAADWASQPNPTDAVLRHAGRCCLDAMRAGAIGDVQYAALERQLGALAEAQGGCERIAGTPLPFAYSLLLHRTASIFCLTLPFALAGALGWWTLLPVLLVSYTFFGLDALSDQLETPFGLEANDLPLSAICRTIERELLAALGEAELPQPVTAKGHVLL